MVNGKTQKAVLLYGQLSCNIISKAELLLVKILLNFIFMDDLILKGIST